MKFIIGMLLGLAFLGCTSPSQNSKKLTPEEIKAVGTYIDAFGGRTVLMPNLKAVYSHGAIVASKGAWQIVRSELHVQYSHGGGEIFTILPNGNLKHIASVLNRGGKRIDVAIPQVRRRTPKETSNNNGTEKPNSNLQSEKSAPVTNRILLWSSRDGKQGIYAMKPDGGDQRKLVDSPYCFPRQSPNGRIIAFLREKNPGSSSSNIFIMNADGTRVRQLTKMNSTHPHQSITWSPDGKQILYAEWRLSSKSNTSKYNYELCIVDVINGVSRNLTNSPNKNESFPHWSADGSKIVFHSDITGGAEQKGGDIYVINSNGSGRKRLTTNAARDWCASWAPNGEKIAFWSDRTGDWAVYLMNPDGSDQRQIGKLNQWKYREINQPVWSPDGKSFLISADVEKGNAEIIQVEIKDGKTTKLTRSLGDDYVVDWWSNPKSN